MEEEQTIKRMKASDTLRVINFEPAILHWSKDNWETVRDDELSPSGLGLFYLDMPVGTFKPGDNLFFTFYYPLLDRWEGIDYKISIE